MSKTKIEWADVTINPIIGCSKVSEGCENCYAERMAARLSNMKSTHENYSKVVWWGIDKEGMYTGIVKWSGKTAFVPSALKRIPGKDKRVFIGSMGDLFHESVPFEWIVDIFHYIRTNPQHDFLILTKRPERLHEFIFDCALNPYDNTCVPFRNLWLGVTCENQRTADERIPILINIPATKHFVSVEPMLERIDITHGFCMIDREGEPFGRLANGIDWVICGAETGPNKREMNWQWAGNLYDQCREAGVPFFGKKDSNGDPLQVDGETIREVPE